MVKSILWLLALREVRMARFEMARADMLMDASDEAMARSRARMVKSENFARRAGYSFLEPRR